MLALCTAADEALQSLEGLSPEEVTLTLAGTALQDDLSLDECGINDVGSCAIAANSLTAPVRCRILASVSRYKLLEVNRYPTVLSALPGSSSSSTSPPQT